MCWCSCFCLYVFMYVSCMFLHMHSYSRGCVYVSPYLSLYPCRCFWMSVDVLTCWLWSCERIRWVSLFMHVSLVGEKCKFCAYALRPFAGHARRLLSCFGFHCSHLSSSRAILVRIIDLPMLVENLCNVSVLMIVVLSACVHVCICALCVCVFLYMYSYTPVVVSTCLYLYMCPCPCFWCLLTCW
jgi:hypothetical protein